MRIVQVFSGDRFPLLYFQSPTTGNFSPVLSFTTSYITSRTGFANPLTEPKVRFGIPRYRNTGTCFFSHTITL